MRIDDLILALQRGMNPNDAILAAQRGRADPPDISPAPQPGVMSPSVSTALGASAANTNANLNTDAADAEAKAKADAAINVDAMGASSRPAINPPIPTPRPTAPPPPEITAPAGLKTPVTNPLSAEESPRIIKSPPDLANMYIELMRKNQNAAALDSGLSTIAAGFSKYPENRTALLHGAFNKSGQQNLTSADIIALQKQQVENQALGIRQAAKAGLMKQYKLGRDTVDYLDASGKLDEVIKHKNTQNLTVVEAPDGTKAFWDPIEGKKVVDIPGEKPDTTEFVQGPNGPELRSKTTGARIGEPVGAPLATEIVDTPEGKNLIDKKTGVVIARSIGGAPAEPTDTFERPDGSKFLREKRTGKITEVVAPEKEGDKIIDADRKLARINAEQDAMGLPRYSMEKFLTEIDRQGVNASDIDLKAKLNAEEKAVGKELTSWDKYLREIKRAPGVSVNVSPDGQAHPTPPTGQDYRRYPPGHKDAGKVMIDERGNTELVPIGGGPAAASLRKGEAEAGSAERTLAEAQKKEAKQKIQQAMSKSNVGTAVDKALGLVDTPGAVGFGSEALRNRLLPMGRSPHIYDSAISTITAGEVTRALAEMRAASSTGGALGNVTDFENKMLRDITASLSTAVDADTARTNLIRIKAAITTMAQQRYDTKEDPNAEAKFSADLARNIEEMTLEHMNKRAKAGETKFKNIKRVE